MSVRSRIPNPDLSVGADNKQRWNRPVHRRHGFHNTHRLFRRALMVRSRDVRILEPAPMDLRASFPELKELMMHPAFSAFCCVRGDQLIMEAAAEDFDTTSPHSIQSVTKLHIHLIVGRLLAEGVLSLDAKVADYLPEMGPGYANATVQALLDMAVINDFTEDYADAASDCYTEEIALGWRLPPKGQPETNLKDFTTGITGFSPFGEDGEADYKSANTDVLTLIAASISPVPLARIIEEIADAAGYEGAFHISLSPEHLPAFSGGGCLSARDLARFGLLFTSDGLDAQGMQFANVEFLQRSLTRRAPALTAPKDWLRYSNHLMTDGRFVGHAGYGGQFLLIDTESGISCAYLSVLQNDTGYDEDYMALVAQTLKDACKRLA